MARARFQSRPMGLRLLVSGLALALISACGGGAPEQAMGGFGPVPVTLHAVVAKDLPVVREYTGQLTGVREVEIRARVSGVLEKRLYTEGQSVKRGAGLFQIDAAPFEAQLAAAEAALANAEAREQQAMREFARVKPLAEANASSGKEFDDAQSALALANADRKAAAARLNEARLQLSWAKVSAPIDGIVGQVEFHEGALVQAGADRLTRLTQTHPLHVHFAVPEQEMLARQRDLQNGSLQWPTDAQTRVQIKLADGRVLDRIGHINFSDARVDDATGTQALRAEIPNEDGALKPGQFVRVVVSGALRPQAITVPQKAVMQGPMGKMVFVAEAGQGGTQVVGIRPVQVGEWVQQGEERLWVITDGLKGGDQVITDNFMKLQPGAPVQPAPAAAAPNAAPAAH